MKKLRYLSLLLLWLFSIIEIHAQLGIELAEALKFNVVKISTDLSNGERLDGFGIISGELGNKVYVITAAHVIKGYELEQAPEKIEVEFYIKKLTFPGVVVNEDTQHDVVVLEINKPDFFEFLEWKKDCVDYDAKVYEEVRFIGLNGKWKIIDKGVINEMKNNRIIAQVNVLPGTSGAPLLSNKGIVGMITEDDAGNEATIVEISKLKEIITEDGRFDHMFVLTPNVIPPEIQPDDPSQSGIDENNSITEEQESSSNQIDLINKAMLQLNSQSYSERMAAISSLRLYALTDPNQVKGEIISERLIQFIRNNLPHRKQHGEGITFDRGTFKADDISSALETLQEIRKANNDKIEIDLSGVNFDNVNLSGLDLSGFTMNHSTFRRAFLSGSKYIGTQFNFADFEECASWNSDFTRASFEKARFFRSKFMNPVLVGTNIEKGADLRFALFRPIGLTKSQEDIIAQYATVSK